MQILHDVDIAHRLVAAMTKYQYRIALEHLGLTRQAAAELLGISLRTSIGYANGWPIPEGYAKLLRLMIKLNLKPKDIS